MNVEIGTEAAQFPEKGFSLQCSQVFVDVLYLWHGDEHGPLLILLADVGQPAEDEHPHDHHQHQQPKLLVAAHRHLSVRIFYT